jgi:LAO/AO transport system kinase
MIGSDRELARLISALEEGVEAARRTLAREWSRERRAHVVGLSGPPGVGKSVLLGGLAAAARAEGLAVGILAVDPSSAITGGAILGDRLRVPPSAPDGRVFFRSLAARGRLGGLADVVPAAVRALEAAGYDVVLIETVGVGQTEVEIAGIADTVVLVQSPGAGDEVQGLKASLLEVADLVVLNKCDLPGADGAFAVLAEEMSVRPESGSREPVVRTEATRGEGVAELWGAIREHHARLLETGELDRRRARRLAAEAGSPTREAVR